jgi:hypothetical protein
MSNLKNQIAYQIQQSRLPEPVNMSLGLSDDEFDVGTLRVPGEANDKFHRLVIFVITKL